MSKRKEACVLLATAKVPTRTGIVYLTRELSSMCNTDFIIETDDSDFFRWKIHLPMSVLHDVLQRDLEAWARMTSNPPMITLETVFPSDYPASVPFLRVIRPRFAFHTGHVTVGGSLCTELLTSQGWTPMTPLALLHSVCVMFKDGNGRLDLSTYLNM